MVEAAHATPRFTLKCVGASVLLGAASTTLLSVEASFNLTISATARVKGKLYPNDKYGTMASGWMVNANGSTDPGSWSTVYGGPAKVAGEIKRLRASRENVLTVDLGGFYYKQAFYTYDGVRSAAHVYNMIQYDVAALDTWDLYGCESTCDNYAEWIQTIENTTSFVAANLDYAMLAHPLNATRLRPWDVKVVGGRKVGFVGLVNIELRDLAANSVPSDLWPTVAPAWAAEQANSDSWTADPLAFAIQDLQHEHPECNIIVFVGFTLNYNSHTWARTLFVSYPELDVIIAESTSDIASTILTRTTTSVTDARTAYVHVPPADGAGKYSDGAMSVASLVFDDDGHLQEIEQEMLPLDDDYAADQEVWSYIASIYSNATAAYQEVVGSSSIFVNGDRGTAAEGSDDENVTETAVVVGCRISDCSMGRLINMGIIRVCTDCDFAMFNVSNKPNAS